VIVSCCPVLLVSVADPWNSFPLSVPEAEFATQLRRPLLNVAVFFSPFMASTIEVLPEGSFFL